MLLFILIKMESICRICLSENSKLLIPLFEKENVINQIEMLISMKLENVEGFPDKICDDCLLNLDKFDSFRSLVLESQFKLINENNIKPKVELLDITIKPDVGEYFEPLSPICNYEDDSDDLPLSQYVKTPKLEKQTVKLKKSKRRKLSRPEIDREYKITCYDCMKQFPNRGALTNHKITEHRLNKTCPICLQTFDAKEIYQHYKNDHCDLLSSKGPHKCDMCDREFASILDVERHKSKDHLPPHSTCKICGAVVLKVNYKKHYQRHSEAPVTCKYCGSILKNRDSLRSHLMNHEGFVHTCRVCGFRTKGRQNHRNHMKTHKNDPDARKQMCTQCGKKVVSLKRHLLSHTGERPYPCLYCEKGFTSGYALKVHTRQHKGEKPFMCHLCGYGWHQKVSLVTHLKNKHNQTLEENSQLVEKTP